MRMQIPEKVDKIINMLKDHGFEAYAVGGCVRDSILGRTPGDWDITTSASPYEVKEIFKRTVDTGIAHGTVTVMLDKDGFEVTTYRLDGEYEDNRHPKQVEFTKSLEEDLKRRDFTINAMAYNEEDGLVDLFHGMEDIDRKVIACVGSATQRFDEDALRILRAVRFSAQLDFDIEEETKEAIKSRAVNLKNISAERIREELNKLLLSSYPERLTLAYELGTTKVVLPELDAKMKTMMEFEGSKTSYGAKLIQTLQESSAWLMGEFKMAADGAEHGFEVRKLTNKERLSLLYACLLKSEESHPYEAAVGIETAESICMAQYSERAKKVMQRLKFDNDTTGQVTHLVKYGCCTIPNTDQGMRWAMNYMGTDLCDLWFLFQRMLLITLEAETRAAREAELLELYQRYERIVRDQECVTIKMLHINGKQLIELGFEPGKRLGEVLSELLIEVLNHPGKNEYESLKELALAMK